MRASPLPRVAGAMLLSVVALAAQASTTTPSKYSVEDIGQSRPGWQVTPLAINDAGTSVGNAFRDSLRQRAVVFNPGAVAVLPQSGTMSLSTGINRAGEIVGTMSTDKNPQQRAFWSTNGTVRNLGTLGGSVSTATGVNESGQIVGASTTAAGATHAYLYAGGAMTDLGTLGGQTSAAVALNTAALVVGRAQLANGDTHAFAWQKSKMTDMGTLGGSYAGGSSVGNAVNTAGTVTGQSSIAAGSGTVHAYRWSAANGFDDLGVLTGGTSSFGSGINDSGTIVGCSEVANRAYHAFVVVPGTNGRATKMTDLNAQLDTVTGTGWVVSCATAIDTAGQIVGYGTHNGVQAAFRLTPM